MDATDAIDEATSPAPHRRPRAIRDGKRARWARFALLAFGVGGVLLFRQALPTQLVVTFSVGPNLYSGGVAIPRRALTSLEARVFEADGDREEVARTSLSFPGGLDGPITPPVQLSLPGGEYLVQGRLTTRRGGAVSVQGLLKVDDEERVRVELQARAGHHLPAATGDVAPGSRQPSP